MSESGLLSLIVPTRGRVDGLRRLLDSVRDTAAAPATLEFIAVVDEDDAESRAFTYSGLLLRQVVVPRGQTMGNLNLAGYRVARGQYLMLLNDDLSARTPSWDSEIRRVLVNYPDGVVLVHVNDLIFNDRLCTFPLLTREFCEMAGGVCRPEYRRYRIDDHIHHVFDLIHMLGHTRRVYLPDVVFEHHNIHVGPGRREYIPTPEVHRQDTAVFEELIGERRRLALDCVERIEGPLAKELRAERLRRLENLPDSIALRRREHVRIWRSANPAGAPAPPANPPAAPRGGARIWNALAKVGARWPFLTRFGVGIPPVLADEDWYRARYPDAARSGLPALSHYLQKGAALGYNPNPHFDTRWYLAVNPDVAGSGMNPLVHFVRFGAREGREPNLLFDLHYYRRLHPDAAGVNPLAHFLSTPSVARGSPNAALSLERYLARIESSPSTGRVVVSGPAPLSVIIPTRNRAGKLLRTLDLCRRHAAGCELEFLVVDDGSTDSTAERMRERAAADPRLSFHSLPAGGPAKARNFAAVRARHPVLLFIGDDIAPASDEFFAVHAIRHGENQGSDFAVLGKICWPDEERFRSSFIMARMLEDGSQFAFSRLAPGSFAGWQYFYTSNVSVKKSAVRDWTTEGFDPDFPGAAFEDVEFAYRLWQSETGLRLLYDPASVGLHDHPYSLRQFLDRQYFAGRSLRRMLQLHPELLDAYGLRAVDNALRQPRVGGAAETSESIEKLQTFAERLEADGLLGAESWHTAFLSALFELRMQEGYAASSTGNLAAARAVILQRFVSRVPHLRDAFRSPSL